VTKKPLYDTRESFNYIGKRGLKRKDGDEKGGGSALFTRDVFFPGMLYAKPFLSPYAHAIIKNLDTTEVENYPGVRYVLRYDDPWWEEHNWTWRAPFYGWGAQYEDLLGQKARFAGEAMGFAVCADSEHICDEALRLAKIEWEVLPFYIDAEEAIAPGAIILEPEVNPDTNLRLDASGGFGPDIMGDVEVGFAESDKIIEFEWSEQEETPAGVEALSAVAVWRSEYLDIWIHNQDPLRNQPELARWFGKYHKIRIHSLYQGAQFGFANWLGYYNMFPIVAGILAQKTGKPVKYMYDQSYWHTRSYEQGVYRIKVGFKNDGTIMACQNESIPAISEFSTKMMQGTKIQHFHGWNKVPYFNRPACVCFRHGMRDCGLMNMIFAKVAGELDMDPTELAKINDGCQGKPMSYIDEHIKKEQGFPNINSLDEVLKTGKEAFDWDNKYHSAGTRVLPNGKYHGVGFSHSVAWSPDPNTYLHQFQIAIKVQRNDGGVRIIGRHADGGWTHETTICQVVADELGAKYDDIEFRPFDETGIDTGPGCGSAGLVNTLPMAVTCARKVKQQMLEMCTSPGSNGCDPLFPGLTPDDLDTIESTVFEKNNPENSKTFAEVSSYQWQFYQPFNAFHSSERHLWHVEYMARQATFIEIEVDPETGEIDIGDTVIVNDVGKAINPESINGQQYGGTTMGISHGRNEACVYDPVTGVKLNDNLIDYKWFSFNDYKGPFDCHILESGLGYAPYGAIGCSESLGAVNATTLGYAVYNAIGKWITDFPITPDKVLKALGKI